MYNKTLTMTQTDSIYKASLVIVIGVVYDSHRLVTSFTNALVTAGSVGMVSAASTIPLVTLGSF
jgi:hypothetical protein